MAAPEAESLDGAAQLVRGDARVALGGVEVLVSEQLLDLAFTPKLRSAYESSPLVTSVRVFRIPTPLGCGSRSDAYAGLTAAQPAARWLALQPVSCRRG